MRFKFLCVLHNYFTKQPMLSSLYNYNVYTLKTIIIKHKIIGNLQFGTS